MSQAHKEQSDKKQFNIIPSILFILGVITYIVGTFLPWYPGSLYDLSKLNGGVAALVIPIVIIVAILGILQIINCFAKRNWIRVISGVFGIIVNIASWLTFIGSAVFISKYGSIGAGAYITAIGSVLLTIFSIVLLATNKKKKTNY